jgi:hypothetical protein
MESKQAATAATEGSPMDSKIATMKPDVVTVTSEDRPTPKPVRTSFSEVMARGSGAIVGGAESAMTALPGTSMMALAVRGGAGGAAGAVAQPTALGAPIGGVPGIGSVGAVGGGMAEGPGAVASTGFGAQFLASANAASMGGDGGAAASLQQSEQSNLYYLQLQQQVSQQSQTFEALSNVMKSESDTVKNAISNMH